MRVEIIKLHQLKKEYEPSICAIGYFDGLHLGHQQLIKKVIENANNQGLTKACITFKQDPFTILKNQKNITHLSPLDDKLELLEYFGIELVYLLDFDEEMAHLSVEQFIELLKAMNVQKIVCGSDFCFGDHGKGSVKDLKQAMDTVEVEFIKYKNNKISSSSIEKWIIDGQLEDANHCLGHTYKIKGEVVHGNKIGRTINFPTANLAIEEYVLPKKGTYYALAKINGNTYKAMVNIGYNPTINHQETPRVEAHLLDFDQDIYGEILELYFIKYLRDERCFNSKAQLVDQLEADKALIRGYQNEQVSLI